MRNQKMNFTTFLASRWSTDVQNNDIIDSLGCESVGLCAIVKGFKKQMSPKNDIYVSSLTYNYILASKESNNGFT